MKAFWLILVLLGVVFMSFQFGKKEQPDSSVNEILKETASVIEKKYALRTCGSGVAMPDGIVKELTLAFQTKKTLSRGELRKFLIESGRELLNRINAHEEIQPFLEKRPFTISDVQIIIYNHDKDNRESYDPEISTAENSHGLLTYQTVDRNNRFAFKNEFEETYEEALKIYENQK